MKKTLQDFDQELSQSNDGLRSILGLQAQLDALANTKAAQRIEIGSKAPAWTAGVISCTHFGSNFEEVAVTQALYDWFAQEGITTVLHCGDLTEGCQMRKGHEHEIHKHGFDEQLKWVVEKFPYLKGITTYLISGNHDASHMKNGGADICSAFARQREDIKYLHSDAAQFTIVRPKERKIVVDMIHPDGGSSYALSYKPQKIIESLDSGSKPDVLLIGHFHKAFTLPAYRGVAAILAGCTQRQTGFMRRNGLAAHVGGHIIQVRVLDGSAIVTSTWRGFYVAT